MLLPKQIPKIKARYLNLPRDFSMKLDKVAEKKKIKPFLRWAGGKTWLIKYIEDILKGINFNNYFEPFLGGGSLFFNLLPNEKSYLSDLNCELIGTYIAIRDNPEDVIVKLAKFQNDEHSYYKIRELKSQDPILNAARFIYLNQTSFNGIYRVNLKGEYNVPYGFRSKSFFDPGLLRNASSNLQNCIIRCCDFDSIIEEVGVGDLVFMDPPYSVTHNDNGFIKYNQKLFSFEDQIRLNDLIVKLRATQAFYILSNAHHPIIKELFGKNDTVIELNRANLVGGRSASRGIIQEYLFTNII